MINRALDGPIPGENYTSDTKNYPWHRPPEIDNLEKAIELASKKLTEKKAALGVLTLVEAGVPLVTITDMFVTSGIGEGKWTPDFAIMLAGPITRILELMAKGAGVPYTLGIEDDEVPMTINFLKGLEKVTSKQTTDAIKAVNVEDVPLPEAAEGFMSPMTDMADEVQV